MPSGIVQKWDGWEEGDLIYYITLTSLIVFLIEMGLIAIVSQDKDKVNTGSETKNR